MTNEALTAEFPSNDLPSGPSPHIAWNLVTRNLHGHPLLRKRIRQKIAKFERHLVHYPLESLHLQITLERHPTKLLHTASLTLSVPSQVLHSQKTERDLIKAFDESAKALLRELIAFKRHARREDAWKRRERRAALHARKVVPFADEPQPAGNGPQSLRDVVRGLVDRHYRQLLRYARRQLWHDVSTGELPRNAIDPRAVVDAAVGRALLMPERRPERLTFVLWLFALVREELERRRRIWRERQDEDVPLDAPQDAASAPAEDEAEGYDAEQPLDLIERGIDPQPPETAVAVADADSPAETAARRDLLAELRRVVRGWPQPEREMFELHFVEGFDVDEIAMITRKAPVQVAKGLALLQDRLRDEVRRQALL